MFTRRQIFHRRKWTLGRMLKALLTLQALEVLVMIVELVGIPIAAYSLYQSNQANMLSAESLKQAEISSVWQIIGIPGAGSTGKVYALETLHELGEPLENIDLSCPISDASGCHGKVSLPQLHIAGSASISPSSPPVERMTRVYPAADSLSNVNLSNAILTEARFSDVEMRFVKFENAEMSGAGFTDSTFWDVSFAGAHTLSAWFERSHLFQANFTGVGLVGMHFADDEFSYVNISGATVCVQPFDLDTDPLTAFVLQLQQHFDAPEVRCADQLQAIFDGGNYVASNPPPGLWLAPLNTMIKPPCLTLDSEGSPDQCPTTDTFPIASILLGWDGRT